MDVAIATSSNTLAAEPQGTLSTIGQPEFNHAVTLHRAFLLDLPHGERADFSGRDLRFVQFDNLDLTGAVFDGASLAGVELQNTILRQASFKGADLSGCTFHACPLDGSDCSEANLRSARFVSVEARGASFHGADLTKVRARDVKFDRSDLRADLDGATFTQCSLRDVVASGVQARDVVFNEGAIAATTFEGADLSRAVFRAVRCEKVNFAGATLDDMLAQNAPISFSKFDRASGQRVRMVGVLGKHNTLSGANISDGLLEVCSPQLFIGNADGFSRIQPRELSSLAFPQSL